MSNEPPTKPAWQVFPAQFRILPCLRRGEGPPEEVVIPLPPGHEEEEERAWERLLAGLPAEPDPSP